VIVDEAKSIDEEIFRGIDRCDYSVLAYISSPDEKTGRFYEAFQSDQFVKFHAGLKDCKHIGKERIAAIKEWYGANSPYTGQCWMASSWIMGQEFPTSLSTENWRRGETKRLAFYADASWLLPVILPGVVTTMFFW